MSVDIWKQMHHWNLVLPPSRPSAFQLFNLRRRIEGLDRRLPVAVLGSTPEFRDSLYEWGFQEIYVLERNMAFHESVSKLRIHQNPEHIVKGDWMDTLNDLAGKFSLILSDLTSGNISYDQRRRLYTLIFQSLKKGGIFYDKVLMHPGPNISVKFLIAKYSDLPLNLLSVNHFSCEMLFCSELLDIEELVDTSLFYSILDEQVKNQRVRAFVEQAHYITPEGGIWYYGRKWKHLESEYYHNLNPIAIDEEEASSPYYGRVKFFTHKKE